MASVEAELGKPFGELEGNASPALADKVGFIFDAQRPDPQADEEQLVAW